MRLIKQNDAFGKPTLAYFAELAPQRITFGRELRKLTKTALAELIDKSASAVSQFESGKSGLDFETFQKIIEALNLPAIYFTENHETAALGYDMANCHFRAKRNVSQLDRCQSFSYAKSIISIYNSLENYGIQFPAPNVPRFTCQDLAITEAQIEKIADSARKYWELGPGPIHSLSDFLESIGVRIIFLPDENRGIDGFSTWVNGQPYIMVVGSSCASRLQFDYAHELAHIILHIDDKPGDLDTERVANRFAGAFLMPLTTFADEGPRSWRGLQSLFDIKERWRVSMAAALFRSRQIGIMQESAYRWAMIKLSETGQRLEERGEFEKSTPTLLKQAFEIISQEVSIGELAESVRMTPDMLISILLDQGVPQQILDFMTPKQKVAFKAKVLRFSKE